jgi:hypothetical protein
MGNNVTNAMHVDVIFVEGNAQLQKICGLNMFQVSKPISN